MAACKGHRTLYNMHAVQNLSLRTRMGVFLCGVCYDLSIQDVARTVLSLISIRIPEENLVARTILA